MRSGGATIETKVTPVQEWSGGDPVDSSIRRIAQLTCRVDRHLHAIPIEHVIEIMRVLPIETIAAAPDYVRGLCIIRGVPVPVVDVGVLISKRPASAGRLVVVKTGNRMVALQVDEVVGVTAYGAAIFNDLPPLLRDVAAETLAGIGTLDSELLLILRLTRIVPEELSTSIEEQAGEKP
jgi:purine-binding chemotaxis protein CheW